MSEDRVGGSGVAGDGVGDDRSGVLLTSGTWAPRLRASARRQWPLVVVLLGVAAGLVVVASHHFRRGTFLIGCCLLAAAALRAGLPERRTGMLAVRSRAVDIFTTGGFGLALVLLTVVVPRPS